LGQYIEIDAHIGCVFLMGVFVQRMCRRSWVSPVDLFPLPITD
jgi:hypothetical protein